MNFIGSIVLDAFKQHHSGDSHYLAGKKERLEKTDKFQALLFLNDCDLDIQVFVADAVGVELDDLRTTIKTLRYF